jgi:hypothetical protein
LFAVIASNLKLLVALTSEFIVAKQHHHAPLAAVASHACML